MDAPDLRTRMEAALRRERQLLATMAGGEGGGSRHGSTRRRRSRRRTTRRCTARRRTTRRSAVQQRSTSEQRSKRWVRRFSWRRGSVLVSVRRSRSRDISTERRSTRSWSTTDRGRSESGRKTTRRVTTRVRGRSVRRTTVEVRAVTGSVVPARSVTTRRSDSAETRFRSRRRSTSTHRRWVPPKPACGCKGWRCKGCGCLKGCPPCNG